MTDATPTTAAISPAIAELNSFAPSRPAGALPSIRTLDSNLAPALESDDLTLVKQELIHTWAHFMGHDLILNEIDSDEGVAKALAAVEDLEEELTTRDIVAITLRWVALIAGEAAYISGHSLLEDLEGLPSTDELLAAAKTEFSTLDFSDPRGSSSSTYPVDSVESFLQALGLNPADFTDGIPLEDDIDDEDDIDSLGIAAK